MIIEFFIAGIACFMCAFAERNNPVKIIPFAVPLGILVCLFAITHYYDFDEIIIVRIILVFLMLIIVFVYPFFKKIKDKKVHKNTKT